MLTIYIDFKSAPSYLALKPTLSLVNRLGAEVVWRPLSTFERSIPEKVADVAVSNRHREVRQKSRNEIFALYADIQGTELRFPETPGETDLALCALSEISGDPVPFINAAFAAYWRDNKDLNKEEVVRQLLADSGVQCRGDLSAASSKVKSLQEDAENAGIFDAPAYVIAGQVFIGREHLPWIEELMRSGA